MHTHASCHEYVLNPVRSFGVILLPVDITVTFAKIDPHPGPAQTRLFDSRVGGVPVQSVGQTIRLKSLMWFAVTSSQSRTS